jgi:hypothetical protein
VSNGKQHARFSPREKIRDSGAVTDIVLRPRPARNDFLATGQDTGCPPLLFRLQQIPALSQQPEIRRECSRARQSRTGGTGPLSAGVVGGCDAVDCLAVPGCHRRLTAVEAELVTAAARRAEVRVRVTAVVYPRPSCA